MMDAEHLLVGTDRTLIDAVIKSCPADARRHIVPIVVSPTTSKRTLAEIAERRAAARPHAQSVFSVGGSRARLCRALIAERLRLPAPSVASVIESEHLLDLRKRVAASFAQHAPVFSEVSTSSHEPLADVDLAYPYRVRSALPGAFRFDVAVYDRDGRDAAARQLLAQTSKLSLDPSWGPLPAPPLFAEPLEQGQKLLVVGTVEDGEAFVQVTLDDVANDVQSTELLRLPSRLPAEVVTTAGRLACRCAEDAGLKHTFFTARFSWIGRRQELTLRGLSTDFPALAAPLVQLVDGFSMAQAAQQLGMGRRPSIARRAGAYPAAVAYEIRLDRDGTVERIPDAKQLLLLRTTHPGLTIVPLVRPGHALSTLARARPSHVLCVACAGEASSADPVPSFTAENLGFLVGAAIAVEPAPSRRRRGPIVAPA